MLANFSKLRNEGHKNHFRNIYQTFMKVKTINNLQYFTNLLGIAWKLDPNPGSEPVSQVRWKNRTPTLKITDRTKNFVIFSPDIWKTKLNWFTFIYEKESKVQNFVFVQIGFEKCTTNFYFENGKVGTKTATANL